MKEPHDVFPTTGNRYVCFFLLLARMSKMNLFRICTCTVMSAKVVIRGMTTIHAFERQRDSDVDASKVARAAERTARSRKQLTEKEEGLVVVTGNC